tara:strand:- start:1515 stop:1889 length:375 start_codon:yes stop_codon:yes gene_type:complete
MGENYDKPWTEEGDFGPRIITDYLNFYFDSYDLYNTLNKHSKPELYSCYDKGDEFGCNIRFENIEHLKDFFNHLTEITELSSDEIFAITGSGGLEIWDILHERYTSEERDRYDKELRVIIGKND